ncbi:putative heat shock protein 70 family protein [Tanacetum coccineum]
MGNHCVREFKRKWNKDLTGNQRALGRLRFACEKVKRILSCTGHTSVELDCLHEGIDFSLRFTRAKLEELNTNSFDKCFKTVKSCLSDANMEKSCVNEVIIVGGSSRISKVQSMLQEFFDGKQLCKSVNPDEAVAHGAAITAANLSGNSGKGVQDLMLLDVTPLSLGDLKISGIPRAPKGFQMVNKCLKIYGDGIITVTAEILSTGKTEKLVIRNENGRLSKEEISKMVRDAERYKLEDQEFKKKADAFIALEDRLYDLKHKMKDYNVKNGHSGNLKKMEIAIANTTEWLQDNPFASLEELKQMKLNLESVCRPMFCS